MGGGPPPVLQCPPQLGREGEAGEAALLLGTGDFFTETVRPESAWTGIENQTTEDVQRPLVTVRKTGSQVLGRSRAAAGKSARHAASRCSQDISPRSPGQGHPLPRTWKV